MCNFSNLYWDFLHCRFSSGSFTGLPVHQENCIVLFNFLAFSNLRTLDLVNILSLKIWSLHHLRTQWRRKMFFHGGGGTRVAIIIM